MKNLYPNYFFFHLSKMEITSDKKIKFGNQILDTNTMTVTTTDDPTKELIPSIALQLVTDSKSNLYNKSIPDNLKITIKNDNVISQPSNYTKDGFYFEDKKITPNTTIEFELNGYTDMCTFGSLLGKKTYPIHFFLKKKNQQQVQFDRKDQQQVQFDLQQVQSDLQQVQSDDVEQFMLNVENCSMPVVLELYYSFSWYETLYRRSTERDVKIRTDLLEELNDLNLLSIPGPLLEECFRYNRITFMVSSARPDFDKSEEEVYEVKSTKKNRCKFYDEFLKLWNIFLNQAKKTPLPNKPNFYIVFEQSALKLTFG